MRAGKQRGQQLVAGQRERPRQARCTSAGQELTGNCTELGQQRRRLGYPISRHNLLVTEEPGLLLAGFPMTYRLNKMKENRKSAKSGGKKIKVKNTYGWVMY